MEAERSIRNEAKYRLWLQLPLGLLVVGIFILVSVGGAVTSYDVGMAVPDWPGTFGHQMFIAPTDVWFRDPATGEFFHGTFWEHSHRLVGAIVGVLAIFAAVGISRTQEHRPWVIWLSLVLLGLIVMQGLLGGLRVSENSRFLAGVHGVMGQAIFGLSILAFLAVGRVWMGVSSRMPDASVRSASGWRYGPPRKREVVVLGVLLVVALSPMLATVRNEYDLINWGYGPVLAICGPAVAVWLGWCGWRWWNSARGPCEPRRVDAAGFDGSAMPQAANVKLRSLALIVLIAVLGQLVLGASVRHGQADLAIPDAPLVYGSVLPPVTDDALMDKVAEAQANGVMVKNARLGPVWLNYAHRIGAIIVSLAILSLVGAVFASGDRLRKFAVTPAVTLLVLLLVQIAWGLMTVWSDTYPTFATAHQATGALLLATTVVLVSRVWLLTRSHVDLDADQLTTPAPAPASASDQPATNQKSSPAEPELVGSGV